MRLLKKGEFSPPRHKGRKDLLWTSFLLRALGVLAVPFFSGLSSDLSAVTRTLATRKLSTLFQEVAMTQQYTPARAMFIYAHPDDI